MIRRLIKRQLDRALRREIGLSTDDLHKIGEFIGDDLTPKSVSGATELYLNQIVRDFPDFLPSEAEREIAEYIKEYIEQKQGMNVQIHRMAISGYRKSESYAMIQYQCAVGYDTVGQDRCETRYQLEYTLTLTEKGVASVAMKCPNCGAALEKTDVTNCPYCDIKIVRDTILNWEVTSMKEK